MSLDNSSKIDILFGKIEKRVTLSNVYVQHYSLNALKQSKELNLFDVLSNESINNFIYINKDTLIIINSMYDMHDERRYFENLKEIFKILNTHKRRYKIKINVKNRELLKKSNLLNYIGNIDLIINNSHYNYSVEEYLAEEEKLEKLIIDIKEADLSPFEKYIAVYNIVKHFKQYKENPDNPKYARSLKYILENDYIVCVGYATLLTTLLDKLSIPSFIIRTYVDGANGRNDRVENIELKLYGHQRNIIKIDDDKYNIHGIYIADATWDNSMQKDLYNNAILTFDRLKEAKKIERMTTEDLLLDFHNFEEFDKKINLFLRLWVNTSYKGKYLDKVVQAYEKMYESIMKNIIRLDYKKYVQLYNKYGYAIKEIIQHYYKDNNIGIYNMERLFSDFLGEYYNYIIKITNKDIDKTVLYKAIRNVLKKLNDYSDDVLEYIELKTKTENEKIEQRNFPYIYDPQNDRANYLKMRITKKK